MRQSFAILLPFLALAGCGGGGSGKSNLDRPDGSFDRARYREINVAECAGGMRRANASIPQEEANRRCGCIIERIVAGSSDDDLRTFHRTGLIPVVRSRAATEQCEGNGRSPYDVDEEPPPPEEPPPSMSDGLPPAVAPGEPAAGTAGRARARANLASYLSPDDYPAAALRNNEQGLVAFTLDIGPDGRVAACRIRQSSGSAALDSATCRIMRSRARYTPARNARGVAVIDRQDANVRWVLPGG
jgi:TonB family protein